jgi:PAS domain-containing protein
MSFSESTRRRTAVASMIVTAAGVAFLIVGATLPAAMLLVGAAIVGTAGWWGGSSADATGSERTQDLIARMSHELRTPLTSVLGMLDVVHGNEVMLDDEERDELLTLARSEAYHMEHLVTNLHTAARLARNVLHPHPQPIALVPLVARIVDRFPAVARRTYLPAGDLRAFADPRLTAQIITNLIQNVDRYAPAGELTIAIERRKDLVSVAFSDDGPGITPDRAARIFEPSQSEQGLGIGLTTSRELAETMGGTLKIEPSRRSGATFVLALPYTDLKAPADPELPPHRVDPVVAHSPRVRLLVDLAAAFAERSLDRTMAGIYRMYSDLLGATGAVLMIPQGEAFRPVTGGDQTSGGWVVDTTLSHVLRTGMPVELSGIASTGAPEWQRALAGRVALTLPVKDGVRTVGVLVVGFNQPNDIPDSRAGDLADALAQLAAFAIYRSTLARDVAFERTLRSSVMEALPIAISVFAGDPPVVIDWNQRERDLLGLASDEVRPSELQGSQHLFAVRFADGTPLTVDTAPVTAAIRTGRSMGPFLLNIRRLDGTEVTTRTYCAPFFGEDGRVAGAVVTSEELDVARPGHPTPSSDGMAALRRK